MKRFKTALPHPMLYGLAIAFAGTASAQESATQVRNSTLGLEEIVVTAGRSEARRGDIAQQMELITADKLALTPAGFITDSLKKSASVDIIQYPGGLSGIGLRGFRPQFSGINQQVLVLIDGRPAGATSLGTLPQASIQRIEVIKGSSSSVYGASAMGGVVNFLTSDSEGPIGGEVAIRAGDFGTLRGGVTLGGSLTERISFDLGLEERSQRDDFRMGKGKNEVAGLVLGDGKTRPSTSYQTRSAFSRLGVEINEVWSADLRTNLFMGRDVEAPGAESDGTINQANRDSDAWSGDFRINGSLDKHKLQLVAYTTSEQNQNTDVTSSVPRLSGTTNETRFNGFQISDAFRISDTLSLVAGIDLETIEREGSGRNVAGTRIGPTSPDESRDTTGAYLDLTARLLNERLILNAGVRSDRIESTLKATPLRADFKPGSSKFETVNPRAGAVLYPFEDRALRLHASIGEGFVPPAVRQIAGSSESRGTGGQLLVTLGNPNLKPESSVSTDIGVGYESENWGADITWFRTDIEDSIQSIITLNTPARRETTSVNATKALAQGLEATLEGRIQNVFGAATEGLSYSLSATYYSDFEQDLPAGTEVLRNVARFKINGNINYDTSRFGVRLSARHVSGMHDSDFSRLRIFTQGRGGIFAFPDITLLDFDARYFLSENQSIGLQIENITDEYYFEKNDYPMQGRMLIATFRHGFR